MISDLSLILYWWSFLFLLGAIFFPITRYFLSGFFDHGYPFAKVLGILVVSYFVWIAGSLHLMSFSFWAIWLVIFSFLLGNLFFAFKTKGDIKASLTGKWRFFVLEELFFLIALILWSWVRGFQPDIEGLEKFMDFGFMNSILRGQYFPPQDMWFANQTINYYYFGHLVAAILTKISGLSSSVTYNLMIATIFAQTANLTFSLAANLLSLSKNKLDKTVFLGGLISSFLVTLGGNMQPLWWFLNHNFRLEGYWYPDATRFIVEKFGAVDNTIHEFPIYSFVVSDLHGHVSNIPFVLLSLALFLALFTAKGKLTRHLPFLGLISLLLGTMYMTNSWDFPIYLLVLGLSLFIKNFFEERNLVKCVWLTALPIFFIVFLSLIFSLPFHLNFSQIAKGIDLVHARSYLWQLLYLWGYQWGLTAAFLLFLGLAPRLSKKFTISKTDFFTLVLLAVATFLIILPEIIYVKDIYISSYHRANTMFKFVYQSFILYGLAAGYIIVRLLTSFKSKLVKALLTCSYLLLITFPAIYPYLAVNSYYGINTPYGGPDAYKSIEGLNWLVKQNPDDYDAVLWLATHVSGQPTVLEAVGDSYTTFNRVSMATGLPTIQGWLVHEWLWRGSFDEPGKRASEVETIYTTKDINLAKTLIDKYQVKYVFIGSKEKEKYLVNESKFKTLGKVVFEQGSTKIVQIDSLSN